MSAKASFTQEMRPSGAVRDRPTGARSKAVLNRVSLARSSASVRRCSEISWTIECRRTLSDLDRAREDLDVAKLARSQAMPEVEAVSSLAWRSASFPGSRRPTRG